MSKKNIENKKEHTDRELVVDVRSLYKEFRNGDIVTKVLKGLELKVYSGEFLCLLGESGCGKTTLLNIISGIDTATAGEVICCGENITKATQGQLSDFRRKNIGYIFQNYNLMPNLTAVQNLNLIGELVDNPMDAAEALSLVGLLDQKDKYPSQLSGGQQQRVSIARALIKRPSLIIADEPTAALDCATSIEVLSVMEKIIDSGATLVMVTHNEEITKMADRVVRIRDGIVHEESTNDKKAKAASLSW